jgi:hypothetical protein
MSSQQRPNMRETIYRTHLEEYAERWQDENLAAGTPLGTGTVGGGCGAELDRFLAPSDVVELEIAGIGVAPERGRGGSGEHVAAAVAGGGGGGLRGATDESVRHSTPTEPQDVATRVAGVDDSGAFRPVRISRAGSGRTGVMGGHLFRPPDAFELLLLENARESTHECRALLFGVVVVVTVAPQNAQQVP